MMARAQMASAHPKTRARTRADASGGERKRGRVLCYEWGSYF
jgi:hypothetical protein